MHCICLPSLKPECTLFAYLGFSLNALYLFAEPKARMHCICLPSLKPECIAFACLAYLVCLLPAISAILPSGFPAYSVNFSVLFLFVVVIFVYLFILLPSLLFFTLFLPSPNFCLLYKKYKNKVTY